MKKLIKYFKILPYGLQYKQMIFLGILFVIIGLMLELMDGFSAIRNTRVSGYAGIYFAFAGVYAFQLGFTPGVAKLVKSSPMQRQLFTIAPTLITLIISLISHTVFVLIRVFFTIGYRVKRMENVKLEITESLYITILLSAAFLFLALVYQGFCYRYYVASTAVFVVLFSIGLTILSDGRIASFLKVYFDLYNKIGAAAAHTICIAGSYLIICLGAAACWLSNVALYRKPLSELAFKYALKQAAK